MRRKLPVINFILILILFLLLGWGGYSWWQPQFSSTVKEDSIVSPQRELIVPTLTRQPYSKIIVGDVTRLNLFRKQRKKFYRPKPPKPKPRPQPKINPVPPQVAMVPPPPPQPVAPPPKLILTGVVLLNGKQVAIFEGTYSDVRSGKLVQNLKPRRRGYKIGESLGGYRIDAIHKTHATLTALKGNKLTLKVSKSSTIKEIQKIGSSLTQKSKAEKNKNPMPPAPFASRKSRPDPIPINPSYRVPPPPGASPGIQGSGLNNSFDPSQPGPRPLVSRKSPSGF